MNAPGPASATAPASAPARASAADAPRRPVPRQFLERVSRALLVRLLADHASVLEGAHAFPLPALAASPQTDRTHVDTLWHLLGDAPAYLVMLRDDLISVADVATSAGHEMLLGRDTTQVLDRELGAEDCAATARLEHRALFDAARPHAAGQAQIKSFASFQSASPRPHPGLPSCRAAFERLMTKDLEARGRSNYFRMYEWRSGTERHMELVYGRLASARDLIGKTQPGAAHDVTAQVTDRTTERAHAVVHDDTLHLDVAGHDWVKEVVRRLFGETHFDSATHFQGDETITLAPLDDLAAALSADGIPGLKSVELQEVWLDFGGTAWVACGARNDCLKSAAGEHALRALSDGKPAEATFHLYLANRTRPLKLKVAAPRRLEFDRREARVVRIVRDWVVARGFMSVPEHVRTSVSDELGGAPSESGLS